MLPSRNWTTSYNPLPSQWFRRDSQGSAVAVWNRRSTTGWAPVLIVCTVSVNVKQQWKKKLALWRIWNRPRRVSFIPLSLTYNWAGKPSTRPSSPQLSCGLTLWRSSQNFRFWARTVTRLNWSSVRHVEHRGRFPAPLTNAVRHDQSKQVLGHAFQILATQWWILFSVLTRIW